MYLADTRLRGEQNRRRAIYSDHGDDSTRPSKPSSWDGWHKMRPGRRTMPVPRVATGLTPAGHQRPRRALARGQEPGYLGGGCWSAGRPPVSVGAGVLAGPGAGCPWWPRLRPQAVVPSDSSRHAATTDRCTSGYDELADQRPRATPEPLLPRRARAPVNAPLALAATASGRADPGAGGIPRPGLGGRRRSAGEWSWTSGRAHRRPACSDGPRGGPR
jgi:hypothetical protein